MNLSVFPSKMKRVVQTSFMSCIFLLSLLFTGQVFAQSINTNLKVPNLDICGKSESFTVHVKPGATAQPGAKLTISFPEGMEYDIGSVLVNGVAATTDGSPTTKQLTVAVPLEAAGQSAKDVIVQFKGKALCNSLDLGNAQRVITYTLKGAGAELQGTSNTINLRYAKLNISIKSLDVASIGAPVTRTITVRNSGNAPITGIYVPVKYGDGIKRISSSTDWVFDEATDTYFYNKPLADGASITFEETVALKDCGEGTSEYGAYYGCDGECEIGSAEQLASNKILLDRSKVPNLVLTHTDVKITCVGTKYLHTYTIKNLGSAAASDVVLNISAADKAANISNINQTGGTVTGNVVHFESIAAGETRVITFDQDYPAVKAGADCAALPNKFEIENTSYKLEYKNYAVCDADGNPTSHKSANETAPGFSYNFSGKNVGELDARIGQPYKGDFRFDDLLIPKGSYGQNAVFNFEIEISEAMLIKDFDPQTITIVNGRNTYKAGRDFDVTGSAGKYTVSIKHDSKLWPEEQELRFEGKLWNLNIPMSLDCDAAGDASYKVSANFDRGYGCGDLINFKCETTTLTKHCDTGDGAADCLFKGESFLKRMTIGANDNDNNALPDNVTLFSLNANDGIQNRSFIAYDILEISQKATVKGSNWLQGGGFSVNYPTDLGIQLIEKSGKVTVSRAGQSFEFTDLEVLDKGNNTFETVIPANLPNGFFFEDGDKIVVSLELQPTIQNAANELKEFPTNVWLTKDNLLKSCGDNFKATGIYGSTVLEISAHKNNFQMPDCSAEASGVSIKFLLGTKGFYNALFLNEFRQRAMPKNINFDIPSVLTMTGYTVEILGNSLNAAVLKGSYTLPTPVTGAKVTIANLDKLLAELKTKNADATQFLDEGFEVIVRPIVKMECAVTPIVTIPSEVTVAGTFHYKIDDNKSENILDGTKIIKQNIKINTDSDKLIISTPVRKENAYSNEVHWIIEVRNDSDFRNFKNVWLSKTNIKDHPIVLRAQEVYSYTDKRFKGQPILSLNEAMIHLGDVAPNTTKYFQLTGYFTSCDPMTMAIAYGSACEKAPDEFADAECSTAFKEDLEYEPQEGLLQIVFKNEGERPALCQPIDYLLEINNAGGEANTLSLAIPIGHLANLKYVVGSAFYSTVYSTEQTNPTVDFTPVLIEEDGVLNITIDKDKIAKLRLGERFYLKFQLVAETCDFKSGQSFEVSANGINFCNTPISEGRRKPSGSERIIIAGTVAAEPTVELNTSVKLNITDITDKLTANFSSSIKNTGKGSDADPVPDGTNITSQQRYFIELPAGWEFVDAMTSLFKTAEATYVGVSNNRQVFHIANDITPGSLISMLDKKIRYTGDLAALDCAKDFGSIKHGLFSVFKPMSICDNPSNPVESTCESELITVINEIPLVLTKPDAPKGNANQAFCVTANAKVENLKVSFNKDLFSSWYLDAGLTNPVAKDVALIHNQTYYAAQALITGGPCNSEVLAVKVRIDQVPVAKAGEDMFNNDSGTFTLNANAPDAAKHEKGLWTVVSPAGADVKFEDATKYNTNVTIKDKAKVVLKWTLSNTCSHSDEVTLEFQRLVDLKISKTVVNRKTPYIVGDEATYELLVSNEGPGKLFAGDLITIKDNLPKAFSGAKYIAQGGAYNGSTGALALDADFLKGQTIKVTVTATINKNYSETDLVNTATVAVPPGVRDENPGNNNAEATIKVRRDIDIEVTKKANNNEVVAGEEIVYTINIKNNGPATLNAGEYLTVRETLPNIIDANTVTFITFDGHVYNHAGQNLKLGKAFAQGQTITLMVKFIVPATAKSGPPLINTVYAEGPSSVNEPNKGNNIGTVTTPIKRKVDLGVVKVADNNISTVTAGETVSYTITVTNHGVSTLLAGEKVGFVEVIPAGLTAVTYSSIGGAYTPANNSFLLDTDLASGDSFTVKVSGTVAASYPTNKIVNTVTVNTPQDVIDENPDNNKSEVPLTVVRKADLGVVKTADKSKVIAGDQMSYTITVTNHGVSTIFANETITLVENLPAALTGVTYNSTYGTYSGSQFVLNKDLAIGQSFILKVLGTVAAGTSAGEIVNTVEVRTPAHIEDSNSGNNKASAKTEIIREADLAVVKKADKTSAKVGDQLTYTITVTNKGLSTLFTNEVVGVRDLLPAGFVLSNTLPTGGTYDHAKATFTLGKNLALGESFTIVFTGKIAENFTANSMTNTVTINPPTGVDDKVPGNNTSTETTPITRTVDLAVTKSANKNPVRAGDDIEYTITITNNGTATLVKGEMISVTEQLPAATGLEDVTASVAGGHHYTLLAKGVTLNSDFAKDDKLVITVKGHVPAKSRDTKLVNVVNVQPPAGVTDTNPGNNEARVETPIIRSADLKVEKVANKTMVVAGEALSYTITITNQGTTTLSAREILGLNEQLPAGFQDFKHVTTHGTYNPANKTFRLRNDLATGQQVVLTFNGFVAADYTAETIENTVSVSTPTGVTDSDPKNNTSTVVTDVERIVDLSVKKGADKTTVVAGEALNYTITVTNNGVSTLVAGELLGLEEQLPVGLTKVSFTATGGTYDANAKTFKLAANLAKGASFEIKVAGIVDANYTANSITNKVKVSTPPDVKDNDLTNNESTVTTLVTRTADLAVVKVANKTTVTSSEDLEYTITVTNNGVSTLVVGDIVGFDEQLPAGLSNVTYQAVGGTYDANAKSFTLNKDLNAGTSFEVKVFATVNADYVGKTLVNTVKVETPKDVTDNDTTNNDAKVTTEVVRKADLAVVKVADKTTVTAGEALNYTITVTNNGVSTLVVGDVVGLDEQIPTALTNVSFTSADGTYDAKAKTFTLNKALATGASFEVKVSSTVAANYTASTIVNTVKVTTPEGVIDEDPTNNESTVTTKVERKADIAVEKSTDRSAVVAGEDITYRIVVKNNGNSSLVKGERIGLVETMPAAVENPRFASTDGKYDFASSSFTLNKDLEKGGSIVLQVTARVKSSTEEGHKLINHVKVSTPAGVIDEDPTNDESEVSTNVIRIADLKVEKTIANNTPFIGLETTFTVTITNNGPSDATGTTVFDKLKSGYEFVSATTSKGTYDAGTGLWTIGDMPLGAKATMSMIVRVLATGDYANTAIVDLVETDNIIENNEVTITPTPIPAPPIAVDDAVTTKSNTPVDIFILDNDKPGLTNSPLVPGSVEIITQPKNGTITIDADGKVIYTPNHGYVGQDDFVYRVKDELGFWSNEAKVTITIVANDLFIPNVFTPNGDGKNDNFVIIGIEGYERVAITIVNRWGNEVYRNENYDNTWSGKGLNEGTYYYIITPHKNGKSEVIKGWVLIKKR